jgi:hypothetical protein
MSKRKNKPKWSVKRPVPAREPSRAEQAEVVVQDAAAVLTCSSEVVANFSYECQRVIEDVEDDLGYYAVAHEIWLNRPGRGRQIAEALAAFLAERQRQMAAMTAIRNRFDALASDDHEHLEPIDHYRALVRQRLFPNGP